MAFVTLDRNSYAQCPKCGFAVSFLQGQEGVPDANVIEVMSETLITLVCSLDGRFEVSAGEFRNHPTEPESQA